MMWVICSRCRLPHHPGEMVGGMCRNCHERASWVLDKSEQNE